VGLNFIVFGCWICRAQSAHRTAIHTASGKLSDNTASGQCLAITANAGSTNLPPAPLFMDQPQVLITISTRRLRCRPSGLSLPSGSSLGATGRDVCAGASTIASDTLSRCWRLNQDSSDPNNPLGFAGGLGDGALNEAHERALHCKVYDYTAHYGYDTSHNRNEFDLRVWR
jgi:hypothetical protein